MEKAETKIFSPVIRGTRYELTFQSENNAGVFVTDIIIPKTGWTEQTVGDYSYYADITNENIAEAMTPQLIFSAENLKLADSYGISKACKTLDGKLRVYTIKIPQEEIPATLCLYGATKNINLPQGQLPLATATRAGMVKIGDNIDVTDDGTISVPLLSDKDGNGIADVIDDASATDEEFDEMLDEVGL